MSVLLLVLSILAVCSRSAFAENANKPLSEQEILDLVQNYVPSEKIIELVGQFGIGFEPSAQYLKKLRKAGASKELISHLQATRPIALAGPSKPGEPAKRPEKPAGDPLTQKQISALLSDGIPSEAVSDLVARLGISFQTTQGSLEDLRKAGANQGLLDSLQKAKRRPAPDPPSKPEIKEVAERIHEPAKQTPASTEKPETPTVTPTAPAAPEHTGPYNVGGEVSPPQALYTPSAPYSEQARRADLQGTVVLSLVINEHGKVTDITVVSKPLGMGLEESAVRTVATWVFRAAQLHGNPVPVRVNVQVNFQQQN